jgi:hypothetical protein
MFGTARTLHGQAVPLVNRLGVATLRGGSLLGNHGGHMAGRVGSVQQSRDGQSYGFVVYDEADRACVYFGFSSWHEADNAARQAQSLLITAMRCLRR